MFGKNNSFGDKGYQMKNRYKVDQIVVAPFQRISSSDLGPLVETTEQKYIFEVIVRDGKTKYREIFTGFIANTEEKDFNLPYIINPIPFTVYFPETIGMEIPKLCLIWIQNDINYPKEKQIDQPLEKKNSLL